MISQVQKVFTPFLYLCLSILTYTPLLKIFEFSLYYSYRLTKFAGHILVSPSFYKSNYHIFFIRKMQTFRKIFFTLSCMLLASNGIFAAPIEQVDLAKRELKIVTQHVVEVVRVTATVNVGYSSSTTSVPGTTLVVTATEIAVAPVVVSTSAAPAVAPTSAAPSAVQPVASTNTGSGDHSGKTTFYNPGLGSCGITSGPSDMIVALSQSRMLQSGNGNPNSNPLCGKKIRVFFNGKEVDLTVVDTCPGCVGSSKISTYIMEVLI